MWWTVRDFKLRRSETPIIRASSCLSDSESIIVSSLSIIVKFSIILQELSKQRIYYAEIRFKSILFTISFNSSSLISCSLFLTFFSFLE